MRRLHDSSESFASTSRASRALAFLALGLIVGGCASSSDDGTQNGSQDVVATSPSADATSLSVVRNWLGEDPYGALGPDHKGNLWRQPAVVAALRAAIGDDPRYLAGLEEVTPGIGHSPKVAAHPSNPNILIAASCSVDRYCEEDVALFFFDLTSNTAQACWGLWNEAPETNIHDLWFSNGTARSIRDEDIPFSSCSYSTRSTAELAGMFDRFGKH